VKPIHASIEKLDRMGMELIEKHDLEGFLAYLKSLKNTICGRMPIQILLATINATKDLKCETKFIKYD
jgi:AmmeMemoRadiSam system protein B